MYHETELQCASKQEFQCFNVDDEVRNAVLHAGLPVKSADPPHRAHYTIQYCGEFSTTIHGDARYCRPQLCISITKIDRAMGGICMSRYLCDRAGDLIAANSDGMRERRVLAHGPEDHRTMGVIRTRRTDVAGTGVRIRSFRGFYARSPRAQAQGRATACAIFTHGVLHNYLFQIRFLVSRHPAALMRSATRESDENTATYRSPRAASCCSTWDHIPVHISLPFRHLPLPFSIAVSAPAARHAGPRPYAGATDDIPTGQDEGLL
ncbi:hypothetical protein B0H11DRAFT_1912713 [Mycena galericulata]|nr:hypothetical protein B0H11DRAFT_1912713 [Mycena galericulata]